MVKKCRKVRRGKELQVDWTDCQIISWHELSIFQKKISKLKVSLTWKRRPRLKTVIWRTRGLYVKSSKVKSTGFYTKTSKETM